MKKNVSLFLTVILVMAMVVSPGLMTEAYGVSTDHFDVTGDGSQALPTGVTYNSNHGQFTISNGAKGTTITVNGGNGKETDQKIYIKPNVIGLVLKLNGVNIKTTIGQPILIDEGSEVTIKLAEDTVNTLDASETGQYSNCAGLQVFKSTSLVIQGPGTLIAKGGNHSAGIGGGGGSEGYNCGSVTIESGTVTATGGNNGAGIGGGAQGAGGKIIINGGEITATGGNAGAGIGGGHKASGGAITINGGDIRAEGTSGGAGIGGGQGDKDGGIIKIGENSKVKAITTGGSSEKKAIDAVAESSGLIIKAKLDGEIKIKGVPEESYLKINDSNSYIRLPAYCEDFAFTASESAEVTVYSDENLSQKIGKIVTLNDEDKIPTIDLSEKPLDFTKVQFEESADPDPPTPPSRPRPPREENEADIYINGSAEGTVGYTETVSDGQTEIEVVIDEETAEALLAGQGDGATVKIAVKKEADSVRSILSGKAVKSMEEKESILEIETARGTYTIPASQFNIDDVARQLGDDIDLEDIEVNVSISEAGEEFVEILDNQGEVNNYQILVPPVEFTISCSANDESLEISKFTSYVERLIAIPDGIDPEKVITGVVVNPDGSLSHVPTTIVEIDGIYYARINSLTNSVYSLIQYEKTFEDLEGHWSEKDVENLASRLIIKGTGKENFAPDRYVTGKEFATIMARALGAPIENEADFVSKAKLTRQEAIQAVFGFSQSYGLKLESLKDFVEDYEDFNQITKEAQEAVRFSLNTGLIQGYKGKINPKANITRAEASALILRLMQKSNLVN